MAPPNSTKLTTLTTAVFLLLITTTTSNAAASVDVSNLIKETCKQTPNYNICVYSLTNDPRGPKAKDVKTLAFIMIDVVNDKATAASKEIKRLLKSTPSLKEPLTRCGDKYKIVIENDISVAIQAVRFGNPKFGEGAMNNAANVADQCENGFPKGKSPLTETNKVARKVADVASAVIRLLL